MDNENRDSLRQRAASLKILNNQPLKMQICEKSYKESFIDLFLKIVNLNELNDILYLKVLPVVLLLALEFVLCPGFRSRGTGEKY